MKLNSVKSVFNQRTFIMGIAMILVMIYHAEFRFDFMPLKWIKTLGYGGVDIFLFCSGFGCFCSLEKDSNVFSFIKKRFLRIYPTWFAVAIVWIAFMIYLGDMDIQSAIGNIFCIHSFTLVTHSYNWYIGALWLFYILSPYLYEFCIRCNFKQNLLILLLLTILTVPFFNNRLIIIIMSRLPVYFVGMLAGKYKSYTLTTKMKTVAIALSAVSFASLICFVLFFKNLLWPYALSWLPFILITPGLCLLLAMFGEFCAKTPVIKYFHKLMELTGKLSFEFYLMHIFVFKILMLFLLKQTFPSSNLIWWVAIILVFPISWLFNFVMNKIRKRLKI